MIVLMALPYSTMAPCGAVLPGAVAGPENKIVLVVGVTFVCAVAGSIARAISANTTKSTRADKAEKTPRSAAVVHAEDLMLYLSPPGLQLQELVQYG